MYTYRARTTSPTAGTTPESNVPSWMGASYDVWCHNPLDVVWNLLSNLDFKDEFDYVPYCEYDSGHWAWRQVVCQPVCVVLCIY